MQNPIFHRRSNSQMGYSWSDFTKDSGLSTVIKSAESSIRTTAQSILPEKIYDAASSAAEKAGAKLEVQAKEALTNFATNKMNEYMAKPENQKAIVDGGIDALAAKAKAYTWSLMESYKANGLMGLRLTHPALFYTSAVVAGLTVAFVGVRVGRLIVGKKNKVPVKGNPCRYKKGKKSNKSSPSTIPDFSLEDLRSMQTISSAQSDDLKYDDGKTRVWLSRVNKNEASVEKLKNGRWSLVRVYRANPRKEEKLGKRIEKIFVCVSSSSGKEYRTCSLDELLNQSNANEIIDGIYDGSLMATAYKGTEKEFRQAKHESGYSHTSHALSKIMEEVDLGNYL